MNTLALKDVSIGFHDDLAHGDVLRNISFFLKKGSFVSISGPSGAGKSTLLRAILGLIPVREGEIARDFKKPAMVFQNYALFPWLTALENVAYGLKMEGMGRKEREKIAREKLMEVGLPHLERHYPGALSGGQRQRVGLARALAVSPDLLLMDEPFSNLDTITAEELKADLLKLWKQYGMTILMVNHLIPDAIELSDEILIMGAHPGMVRKTIAIDLPRPRNPRSPEFFSYVDRLTEELRTL
ncbi:MAG: ABC transporter ATP-binding protein [bacterium]